MPRASPQLLLLLVIVAVLVLTATIMLRPSPGSIVYPPHPCQGCDVTERKTMLRNYVQDKMNLQCKDLSYDYAVYICGAFRSKSNSAVAQASQWLWERVDSLSR